MSCIEFETKEYGYDIVRDVTNYSSFFGAFKFPKYIKIGEIHLPELSVYFIQDVVVNETTISYIKDFLKQHRIVGKISIKQADLPEIVKESVEEHIKKVSGVPKPFKTWVSDKVVRRKEINREKNLFEFLRENFSGKTISRKDIFELCEREGLFKGLRKNGRHTLLCEVIKKMEKIGMVRKENPNRRWRFCFYHFS